MLLALLRNTQVMYSFSHNNGPIAKLLRCPGGESKASPSARSSPPRRPAAPIENATPHFFHLSL